jgi:hypothetical protein
MRALLLVLLTTACLPAAPPEQPLEDFHLPPKSVFSKAMPRYPNVWFYLDASLAGDHPAAVKLVTGELRRALHLRELHVADSEGCDFEIRLEHFQPWEDPAHRPLQHAHSFHLRYYYSDLVRQHLERVEVGGRPFYRFAGSVHYEVEHGNPNHADVEICPICGRTGAYAGLKGNLVEQVHDPLGLEMLLHGTVRGQPVHFEDWEERQFGSVERLRSAFTVQTSEYPGQQGDRNTYRLGIVVLTPRPR